MEVCPIFSFVIDKVTHLPLGGLAALTKFKTSQQDLKHNHGKYHKMRIKLTPSKKRKKIDQSSR